MERFARLVTAGGVALIVGLWVVELAGVQSLPGLAGAALAVAGAVGVATGIWTELDVDRPGA